MVMVLVLMMVQVVVMVWVVKADVVAACVLRLRPAQRHRVHDVAHGHVGGTKEPCIALHSVCAGQHALPVGTALMHAHTLLH